MWGGIGIAIARPDIAAWATENGIAFTISYPEARPFGPVLAIFQNDRDAILFHLRWL